MSSPLDLILPWVKKGTVPPDGPDKLRAVIQGGDNDVINHGDAESGRTALHHACALCDVPLIREVLAAPGVTRSPGDAEGMTPLALLIQTICSQMKACREGLSDAVGVALELARDPGAGAVDRRSGSALSHALHLAASFGPLYLERRALEEVVKTYPLQEEIPIKLDTSRGAAMICVQLGRPEVLRVVLDFQNPAPNLHATDKNGMTALHIAAKLGDWTSGRLLVERDPSVCRIKDDNGNTALFYFVVKLETREALNVINTFSNNWDFDSVNTMGENVMDYYATYGDRSSGVSKVDRKTVVRALWVYGTSKDSRGRRREGNATAMSVVKEPLEFIKVRSKDSVSPKEDAKRNVQPMHLCLHDMGKVARLVAALCRCAEAGALGSCDGRGYTPLMTCALHGLQEETAALREARPGPDVNQANAQADTALIVAAKNRRVAVMYELLKWPGVNINAADREGNTALFYLLERFPQQHSINIIAGHRWNFEATNYKLQMAGDYYVASARQGNNPQRRYAGPSKADTRQEQALLEVLAHRKSIRHSLEEEWKLELRRIEVRERRSPVEHEDRFSSDSEPSRKSDSSTASSRDSDPVSKQPDSDETTPLKVASSGPVQVSHA